MKLILLIIFFVVCVSCNGIWPHPKKIEGGSLVLSVSNSLSFNFQNSNGILTRALQRYRQYLVSNVPYSGPSNGTISSIFISLISNDINLQLGTSERYNMTIQSPTSHISADNVFGALRALESFSQMIFSTNDGAFLVQGAPWIIEDEPRFPHRGLLIGIIIFSFYPLKLSKGNLLYAFVFQKKKILQDTIFLWTQ